MKLKAGDSVMVTRRFGDQWDVHSYPGKLVGNAPAPLNGYIVQLDNGESGLYEGREIQRYERLVDEEPLKWCVEQLPIIEALIKKFLSSPILSELKWTLKTQVSDGIISLEGVTLAPCTVQHRSIVGIVEFPAFELSDWKYHHATRDEPEDISEVPISQHRSSYDAARALVEYVFAAYVRRWFENEGENQYFEEMKEVEKQLRDGYGDSN